MMETGYPDAPPVRVGTSLADLCGGVYLFSGIVSALYGREKSQRGAHVDIAMFDATLSFLEHGLMAYIATGSHHNVWEIAIPTWHLLMFSILRISRLRFVVVMTSFFCVMPCTGAYGTG